MPTCAVTNFSPLAQAAWAPIVVPYAKTRNWLAATFVANGAAHPAYRGHDVGVQSTVWWSRVRVPGHGRLVGTLSIAETVPPVGPPSGWVTDALGKVVPSLWGAGGVVPAVEPIVTSGPVLSWRLRHQHGGFVLDSFFEVAAGQDAVNFCGFGCWSRPTTPEMQRLFEVGLYLEFGEPVVSDDPSVRVEAMPDGKWRMWIVPPGTTLGDGQGITRFSGAVLCLPEGVPMSTLLNLHNAEVNERLLNLAARAQGRLVGMATDWKGHALAYGVVPQLGRAAIEKDTKDGYLRFLSLRGLWDIRPRAQTPNANQTGNQVEFGAIEGTELWHGETWALPWLMWNATHEGVRPTHFREADGSPVTKDRHPDWWTWSQRTHWNNSQSPDRLGKPHPEPWFESHGWKGEDEEHPHNNLLAACAAVTGDRALDLLIRDDIHVELANVRRRTGNFGAARALGRRLHANVNRWMVCQDRELAEKLWAYIEEIVVAADDRWIGRQYLGAPVRPLNTITATTYLRDPNTGEPVESISMWEHGLAAMGLNAVWCARRIRLDLGLPVTYQFELALVDLTTYTNQILLDHCWFQDAGRWRTAEMIRFDEGREIDPALYLNGGAPGWVKVSGTFEAWIAHAAAWCAHGRDGIESPMVNRDRALSICRQIVADSRYSERDMREWMATAELEWPT